MELPASWEVRTSRRKPNLEVKESNKPGNAKSKRNKAKTEMLVNFRKKRIPLS